MNKFFRFPSGEVVRIDLAVLHVGSLSGSSGWHYLEVRYVYNGTVTVRVDFDHANANTWRDKFIKALEDQKQEQE